MFWGGCDANALSASWNGGIIDGLNIDAKPIEQSIRHFLATMRVADDDGDDVTVMIDEVNGGFGKFLLEKIDMFK